MNKYKVDFNKYGHDYPYAVYVRHGWLGRWEHIASFKDKEEAREYAASTLAGLPIYVN